MSDLLDAFALGVRAMFTYQAIFFALLAIGLNVHFGYTGLLNFGQIAFAMLGGFGLAISVAKWGLPFWVGVLVGLLAAVVLALLLGLPTLRLRADYLAIVTIAAAEALRLLFRSVSATPITNSTLGISAFNGTFLGLVPVGHERSLQHPRHALERRRAVGHHGGLDAGHPDLAAGLGAHAQPVGSRAPGGP